MNKRPDTPYVDAVTNEILGVDHVGGSDDRMPAAAGNWRLTWRAVMSYSFR